MLKNIKKINKSIIYTAIVVIFTFIFSILIPYGGDDWGNYLNGSTNFFNIINIVKRFYFLWEGRIFSRLFCLLIIPNKLLFSIITSVLMGLLYYFLCNITNAKNNKVLYPLIFISLFFIDMETFSQAYVWKTGNITYFIPTVFLFFLVYKRKDVFTENNIKTSKMDFIIVLLSFVFSLFVENITVGILTVLIMNNIMYYLKTHKIDKVMLFSLIASVIAFLIMMLSPGNFNRLNMDSSFKNLSIIEKVLYNIPNLINYTFIKNSFLMVLILIVLFIYIYKSNINKFIKFILSSILFIIPISTVLVYNLNYFIKLPTKLLILLDANRWYISTYWIIFTIILIFILIKISLKNNFKRNIYFIILALVGNGSMMMSPVWGGRTAILTTFSLNILLIFILLDFKFINEKLKYVLNVIMFTFIVMFTIYSFSIYLLNNDREKYIKYQIRNNYEEYKIIILPSYFTWNLNTWGSEGEFAYNFKRAYGIDREAKLIYVKKKDVNLKTIKK